MKSPSFYTVLLSLSILLLFSCTKDESAPLEEFTVYEDSDGDGFGNPDKSKEVTEATDGYVNDNTDCDDTDATINPDGTEIPDNDSDENCDGTLTATWYKDADGDGFGDAGTSEVADTAPDGFVDNALDCDDTNADINPDATEIPDNDVDENCDDAKDKTWYRDSDDDTFGDPDVTQQAAVAPSGYVDNNLDCDDTNAAINPNATEIGGNEVDEDCDGFNGQTWYADSDSDGYGDQNDSQIANTKPTGYVNNSDDCDDTNANINPDAVEIKGNAIDENCDGSADAAFCGDGVVDVGEACDDGNIVDGDGCNLTCTSTDSDGDGIPDEFEAPGCELNPRC